jgi:hypothetical protein
VSRTILGVMLVVVGFLFVVRASRRRRDPRLRSQKPIPGWVYLILGARPVVDNPRERDIEVEGVLAEGIGGAAAVVIGIALVLL